MKQLEFPNKQDGRTVYLGKAQMGAIDYVRSFGGLIVAVLGQSDELKKRFPPVEKNMSSGLILTQTHSDLARLATSTYLFLQERCQPNQRSAVALSGGLWARFADFGAQSAPSAVYTAVVQPGHTTLALDKRAFVRGEWGIEYSEERITRIDGAKEEAIGLLRNLAEYHQI